MNEFKNQIHLRDFLVDPQRGRLQREEKASITAGELVGKLNPLLREHYEDPDSPENAHSLNVLCVGMVFCLFAEDAEVFPKDSFHHYLKGCSTDCARDALKKLFEVLATPPEQRDPYLADSLALFPYVNGGLFEIAEEIPRLADEILQLLLGDLSEGVDWSDISLTIFGGIFESTLNPKTRARGGIHYTSPENIHQVIDPLFLDELQHELEDFLTNQSLTGVKKRNALNNFTINLATLLFPRPEHQPPVGRSARRRHRSHRHCGSYPFLKLSATSSVTAASHGRASGMV